MSSKENDTILGFISHILMDEQDDLDNEPYTLYDSLALQATERSLYEAININLHQESTSNHANTTNYTYFEPPSSSFHHRFLRDDDYSSEQYYFEEDEHFAEHHERNKQLVDSTYAKEPEQRKIMSDGVLLFTNKAKKKSPKGKQPIDVTNELIDLRSLLMKCAKAMADFDSEEVNSLILKIRNHSSPHGNATERVAHYFVNALEARLAGTRKALLASINLKTISGTEILKGYKVFIKAVPLLTMTYLLANGTMMKRLAKKGATTLHIIDFGILLGLQWLSLILDLYESPAEPPKLRITGIDFPQPEIRSDARVLDTGARLAEYCERLRVPFEFNAIAKKWDSIRLEDLKLKKGEMVVVNSMYRLHNVMDQADKVHMNIPRDDILQLIRRINLEMFLHAVISGTYSSPFFLARFREAFFNFLSLFDMYEATVPPEEEENQSGRVSFEEHCSGRSIMSIVACERTDRVVRPETYKQWQRRTVRDGFRQISLDKEAAKYVRLMIRENYHKVFSMTKEGKWILLEWKGRVHHDISCWRPVEDKLATIVNLCCVRSSE